MTTDERATIYGRAMLDLKECTQNIAALSAYFSQYAERLQQASGMTKSFANNPLAIAADQLSVSEHIKADNLQLTRADFGDKVEELISLTRRAQELRAQVERF
jgi:hypothetical protein